MFKLTPCRPSLSLLEKVQQGSAKRWVHASNDSCGHVFYFRPWKLHFVANGPMDTNGSEDSMTL